MFAAITVAPESGYVLFITVIMIIATALMLVMVRRYRRDMILWIVVFFIQTLANLSMFINLNFFGGIYGDISLLISGIALIILILAIVKQYLITIKHIQIGIRKIPIIVLILLVLSFFLIFIPEVVIAGLLCLGGYLLLRIYKVQKTPTHIFMFYSIVVAIFNLIFTSLDRNGIFIIHELVWSFNIGMNFTFLILPLVISFENTLLHNQQQIREINEQYLQAQKMESIGRLAGGIAHDINNILSAIMGNIEIGLIDTEKSHPVYPILTEIRKITENASNLTAQLLAFSRKKTLEPKVIQLNTIINEISSIISRVIGEDIKLKLELSDSLVPIFIDPGSMQQILLNLVVNSRDAMPTGGQLTIQTSNITIESDLINPNPYAKPGKYALLIVSDTGVGMTPEVQKHLFEPFFTTKPQNKGTGLGLSVVFGAIRQANGFIDVYSEPNKGTVIKMYFPSYEMEGVPSEPVHIDNVPLGGSESIIFVEDDETVQEITLKLLEKLGYKVKAFKDGNQAILYFSQNPSQFDLLITDIVMPNINGRQLAEKIKSICPEIKILFISGFTKDYFAPDDETFLKHYLIQKPFSMVQIATKIREILDGKGQ